MHSPRRRFCLSLLAAALLVAGGITRCAAAEAARLAQGDGLRVFVMGHSFHIFIADRLGPLARAAGISGLEVAGRQMIGASSVRQHWDLPDGQNLAKAALVAGDVDVLTMSPNWLVPDDTIALFTDLGLEHNPRLRVRVAAGDVPGITRQSELFTDPIGHGKAPVLALVTSCNFACLYGRSPVGLDDGDAELDRIHPELRPLLQRIAWDTVTAHPMSGVTRGGFVAEPEPAEAVGAP